MPSKKEQEKQIQLQQIQLKDIKLSDSEKNKLFVLTAVILVLFALSIVIYDAIAPHAVISYDYPGNCGNSTKAPEGIDSCLTMLANSTKNVTDCLYIKDSDEPKCALNVALETQNVSYCGAIAASSPYFSQCILTLNKKYNNIALCDYLSGAIVLQCIYNISSQNNFANPNMCGKLTNSTYSSLCNNLYYYKNAISAKNPSYCGYLQSARNATTLYFMNSNGTQSSASALQELFLYSTINVTPQQECYYNLAVITNNQTLCNRVTGQYAAYCSYAVAQYNESTVHVDYNATNLTDACGSYIAGGYASNVCMIRYLSKQALVQKNSTICRELTNSSYSDACILQLALNTSNKSYCAQISNSTIKNYCKLAENLTNTTK